MRRVVFFLSLLLVSLGLQGQPRAIFLQDKTPNVQILREDAHTKTFSFNYSEISFIEVETPQGVYNQMAIPGTYRSGKTGEPQLVSSQKLIVIPKGAQVKLFVKSFQEGEYKLENFTSKSKLIPYQPSYAKDIPVEAQEWVISEKAYQKNSFTKKPIAEIEVLGILRGMQVARITVNPVAYNPVSHKIKCYNNIQVEVKVSGTKTWSEPLPASSYSPYFANIYTALNVTSAYPDHPDLVNHPVRYLIVSPPQFVNSLQSFITWKTQKGFDVVLGNTSTIGSSPAQIRSWIQTQYADTLDGKSVPSFLILVGDIAQVPASQTGIRTARATDLYYASVDGDMFPDMYYGRLPAQDTVQLLAMVAKILLYEKYQFTDDSFLDQATLIAGADPIWNPRVAQPTVKYGTENYFNAIQGYSVVNSYLNSYTDCYTNEKVSVGFINYTAHCSQISWANPVLTADNVSSFINHGKYPLAVGNCCTSGDFSIGTCIGEAWVRNPSGGAIAYLGSVPDTYWWEDFYWAVGAHDPVYNSYPTVEGSSLGMFDAPFSSDYVTTGALLFSGNLAVTEAHNQGYTSDVDSKYYWEAYHCLGDPSLIPYFRKGRIQTVVHPPRLESGVGEFIVEAMEGSTVTLSTKSGMLATAQVSGLGSTTLFFDTQFEGDSVHLVVTKPSHQPYIIDVPVTVSDKAYLALKSFLVDDEMGNNNGLADFNESMFLNLTVENIGAATSEFIEVNIQTENPLIVSYNGTIFSHDSLGIGSVFSLNKVIEIRITDSVPDQTEVWFNVQLSDSFPGLPRRYYNYQRPLLINAPVLKLIPNLIVDDFYGNGNNLADAGESLTLSVSFTNAGHAMVSSTIQMQSLFGNSVSTIDPGSFYFNQILPGDTLTASFDIAVLNTTATCDSLQVALTNGIYLDQNIFLLSIGFDSIVQLGNGEQLLGEYPFNNYYKNNRTQILFKKEEMYQGNQLLKAVWFNFSDITSDASFRDLPNFTVKLISAPLEQLSTFVDMQQAQTLFDTSIFMLPNQTGWYQINFTDAYWMLAPENLILEINWGTSDNYAPSLNRTKVYGHSTSFNSVVFGEDDNTYPAPFAGVSKWRPNVQWIYDTLAVTNVEVKGDLPLDGTTSVSNCQINIGDDILFSDTLGRVKYFSTKWSEALTVSAQAYGYRDTLFSYFKEAPYSFILIELKRNPQTIFVVKNQWGMPIAGANITLNAHVATTNSQGTGETFAAQTGIFSTYIITKEGYHTITDSILPDSSIEVIEITLSNDFADAHFVVLDSRNQPIQGAMLLVDGQPVYSDSMGSAFATDLVQGLHTISIHHIGYQTYDGAILVGDIDTSFTFVLATLGTVNFTVTDGWQPLANARVIFNDDTLFTNPLGNVSKTQVLEGSYFWNISATGYYSTADTLQMFGSDTSIHIALAPIPDVILFVYNGKVPLVGIPVDINQQTHVTDSFGLIKLVDFGLGGFDYGIQLAGYYPVSGHFSSTNSDTLLSIKMNEIADAKIIVTHQGIEVGGALVVLNSDTLVSDFTGVATFVDLGTGDFNVLIRKEGFYDIETDIQIENCDTVFNFGLQRIPEITWQITSSGTPVDSAIILFDSVTHITDIFGQIQLYEPIQGWYSYQVSRTGYFSISDSLSVGEGDTTVHLEIEKMLELLFTITDGISPISQTLVNLDENKMLTDDNGDALFQGLYHGKYHYSVIKTGYSAKEDSIDLSTGFTHEFVWLEEENYQVSFKVTDELGNPMAGTLVACADFESLTDSLGVAILSPFSPNQTYSYTIYKTGYVAASGDFTIPNADLFIELQLELETFDVTFNILDEQGTVQGASVTFDQKVKTTGPEGIVVFYDLLPAVNMQYIVRKTDTHIPDTGFVTFQSDTLIVVPLALLSNPEWKPNVFLAYPNPTHKVLYLLASCFESGSRFQVYNAQGLLISHGTLENPQTRIELPDVPVGSYVIKVICSSYTMQKVFMVY
ncbi:MAG: hypothetical protein A2W84_11305 [Bacteroidetes bacterium GWC2_40_13]|nr:MAG: hypothetical protein A2W84_11305 [Bacteroidetes bacterium GWC2_40_13]